MKNFAIILSGCGSRDGSEIHETTMLMLAVKQLGAKYQCFSIDKEQTTVINSITGEKMNEKRNVMIESARIARGNVKEIKELNVDNFDGIILPGGLGVTLNFSTFAFNNYNYSVDEKLEKVLSEFKEQNKIICAVCIAPIILAKVFKDISITIGNNQNIAKIINDLGNKHINTETKNICIDKQNKIITAPFYMLTDDISVIYEEAYKVIKASLNDYD
ncbi:MAG TPA: isoprenoid biosynthesis glyoxalase ElbB [Rickettsiales bacterium]|nr:isoprenoid biosynthesis glyoxalase ElbB [Rickettsiales bacterium]